MDNHLQQQQKTIPHGYSQDKVGTVKVKKNKCSDCVLINNPVSITSPMNSSVKSKMHWCSYLIAKNTAHWTELIKRICIIVSIDRQVRSIGFFPFVRLQNYNFCLFLRKQSEKRQTSVYTMRNNKRTKENWLGFRFPFETSAYLQFLIHVLGIYL